APASAAGNAAAAPSGSVTYATDQSINTLDPHFSKCAELYSFETLLFEGLVTFQGGSTDKFGPALATDWQLAADNITWTFKLRDGVKFHDGTPFNAEAVKYTFDRLLDPKTGASEGATLDPVARGDVVAANDGNIVTKQPFPELLTNLAAIQASIFSPTAAQKGSPADFGRAPVGTGRYRFKA